MNVLELIVVATFIIILCFLSIIQSVDIQAATPKGVQTSLCKQYDVIDVPISLCQIASPTDSSNILNGLTDYVKYIIHAHENDHKHNLLQCDSRMIMCDGHIRNLLEWSLKDIPKSKTCTGEIDSKDKIKESNIYFNKFEDKLRSHLLVDDKRLGSSACTYYGSIDKKCNFTVLPVENLPTECSSFIFDGCVVDSNFTMTDNFGGDFPKYLEKLMTLGRPIFSFYSRPVDVWDPLLIGFKDNGSTKVKDEVKLITDYLNENKGISGLILEDINLYIQSESNDTSITDNTIKYVETIRSAFPCLAIGLNVIGTSFVDWCLGSTSCIIFDKIDQYVDFYVINLINFNACSEELICGTTPLTGSDEIYTLELLKIVLDTNIIPKDKVHFLYRGSPVYDDFDLCSTTYSGLCINPKVNNKWCADTQKSYADKGKFAKDNGAGFIIENIDLIDPICSCQCDYAFAPFYFLLDGYSNFTTRLICPLFDGNCPK